MQQRIWASTNWRFTPLLQELHWLPGAAHIKFSSLLLTYRVPSEPAPSYLELTLPLNHCVLLIKGAWQSHLFRLGLVSLEDSSSKSTTVYLSPPLSTHLASPSLL